MEFKIFRDAIEKQFNEMVKTGNLYTVEVERDVMWERYMDSFPAGTNEVYKERREYDCNACKHFIRRVGNVVAISKGGKIMTVWDVEVPSYYQDVTDSMAEFVRSFNINSVFAHNEKKVGAAVTRQLLEDESVKSWNHFSCELPSQYVKDSVGEYKGAVNSKVGVFNRGLREISPEAVEIVLDLIVQNSLYRGEEFKDQIVKFEKLQKKFNSLETEDEKNIFVWQNIAKPGAVIRNSVIGTLLVDLSSGIGIDASVAAFESKVAPSNYKRTSAPVTKGMVKKAVEKINELELEPSLHRRFAVAGDLSVNNVLYVDRDTMSAMQDSLESLLMEDVKTSEKSFDKIEEISIDDFMTKVLPEAASLEMLVENRHISNMMSLIAPNTEEPKNIFKWNNPFSWSYNGNITDSDIKERVKAAGGSVTGDLRISLSWFNKDDLDIHLYEPAGGTHVHFGQKESYKSGARLDVDMNVSNPVRDAVENITWADERKIMKGVHTIGINNYTSRESSNVGFEVEVEYKGNVTTFTYDKKVRGGTTVKIIEFEMVGGELKLRALGNDVKQATRSQDVWGVKTNEFHKVSMVLNSPNHWDGEKTGNKHQFFILDGCKNPEEARGIYNEFLRNDLTEHRKVFEVLADKMLCEPSEDQLSGLGFSTTQRNDVVVKVGGSFNRMLRIKF